jgi:hypothetical protein
MDMFSLICENRPSNTNTAILQKTGHTKGRSLMRVGGQKKAKKVNIVDVFSIQE